MSRPEAELLAGIIAGHHWKDAAASAGLSESRARAFLESVQRFASSVGDVSDFGTVMPDGDAAEANGREPASDGEPAVQSTPQAATAVSSAGESRTRSLVVWTDGASLGNPGDAGAGAVVETPAGEKLDTVSEYLGRTTNNVAEYEAVRMGLESAIAHGARVVELRLDSELVARQLAGRYKVRDPKLQEKHLMVSALIGRLDDISIVHIPRERNAEADRLAKRGAKQGTS